MIFDLGSLLSPALSSGGGEGGDRSLVTSAATRVDGGEGGEFVGDDEPEFEGAVQGAVLGDADAGDATFNGGPEALIVFGGGGGFEGEERVVEIGREVFGVGEGVSKVNEGVVVVGIGLREGDVGRVEGFFERGEEFGQAFVSDLAEDGGLGEES